MEAVRIMCQLSETQIYELANYVSARLPAHLSDLEDVDQVMAEHGIRLCVDFDIDALKSLKLLSAEVLNSQWDVLETDSFALEQYLKPIIEDYNKNRKEAIKQAKEIRSDIKTFQPY